MKGVPNMKKSVMLIIVTLSTIALIVIGLLFQKAEIYNETKYITAIVITHVRVGDTNLPTFYDQTAHIYRLAGSDEGSSQGALSYVPGLTVDLLYEVAPSDATNRSVLFHTDPGSKIARIGQEDGRITFLREGTETFTVKAADNSNVSVQLRLRAKYENGV